MNRRRRRSDSDVAEDEPESKRVRPTAEARAARQVRQDVALKAEQTLVELLVDKVAVDLLQERDFHSWCALACVNKRLHAVLPQRAWPIVARMRPGDMDPMSTTHTAAYRLSLAALCGGATARDIVTVTSVTMDNNGGAICQSLVAWLVRVSGATMTPWHDRAMECMQIVFDDPMGQLRYDLWATRRTDVIAAWIPRALSTSWYSLRVILCDIIHHVCRRLTLDDDTRRLLSSISDGHRLAIDVDSNDFRAFYGVGINDDAFAALSTHCFVRDNYYPMRIPPAGIYIAERLDQWVDDAECRYHSSTILNGIRDVVQRSAWIQWRGNVPSLRFNAWVRRLFADRERAIRCLDGMVDIPSHLPGQLKHIGVAIDRDLLRATRFRHSTSAWRLFGLEPQVDNIVEMMRDAGYRPTTGGSRAEEMIQSLYKLTDDVKRLQGDL